VTAAPLSDDGEGYRPAGHTRCGCRSMRFEPPAAKRRVAAVVAIGVRRPRVRVCVRTVAASPRCAERDPVVCATPPFGAGVDRVGEKPRACGAQTEPVRPRGGPVKLPDRKIRSSMRSECDRIDGHGKSAKRCVIPKQAGC